MSQQPVYKNQHQLAAEAAGYSLKREPGYRTHYMIHREDGGPVPRDAFLGREVVFFTQHSAWLAADMFHRGLLAALGAGHLVEALNRSNSIGEGRKP